MAELTSPHADWPGGPPELVGLASEPIDLDDAEAVWSVIAALGPDAHGWICRPHEDVAWPDAPRGGPVLSAELAVGPTTSLHVRRSGRAWRAWRYVESPDGDLVVFRERYRGTVPDHPARRLGYAEYWSLQAIDGIEVYRPFAARFTGWEDQ